MSNNQFMPEVGSILTVDEFPRPQPQAHASERFQLQSPAQPQASVQSQPQMIEFVEAPDASPIPVDIPTAASAVEVMDGYAKYVENGGMLPEIRYQEFLAIQNSLQNGGTPTEKIAPLSIARRAGLELSQNEVFLYSFFRQIMRNEKDPIPSNSWRSSDYDVFSLSDQKLLAEIFLMLGDLAAYNKLVATFPNIFGSREQRYN